MKVNLPEVRVQVGKAAAGPDVSPGCWRALLGAQLRASVSPLLKAGAVAQPRGGRTGPCHLSCVAPSVRSWGWGFWLRPAPQGLPSSTSVSPCSVWGREKGFGDFPPLHREVRGACVGPADPMGKEKTLSSL